MTRRTITETLETFETDSLEGELPVVIDRLAALLEKYENDYTQLRLDTQYDYFYDDDRILNIVLSGARPETDEEYKRRVTIANKAKATKKAKKDAAEAKERAEYERLRKKFENEEPYR